MTVWLLNDSIGSDCKDCIAGEQLLQQKKIAEQDHSGIADSSIQPS